MVKLYLLLFYIGFVVGACSNKNPSLDDLIPPTPTNAICSASPLIFTFTYVDPPTEQYFTIPKNCLYMYAKVWGAGGGGGGASSLTGAKGGKGGAGGFSAGLFNLTPNSNDIYTVLVGGGGTSFGSSYSSSKSSKGGYGGGANGGGTAQTVSNYGGGGGGRSAILKDTVELITAGGGGGGGSGSLPLASSGGRGGGTTGENGGAITIPASTLTPTPMALTISSGGGSFSIPGKTIYSAGITYSEFAGKDAITFTGGIGAYLLGLGDDAVYCGGGGGGGYYGGSGGGRSRDVGGGGAGGAGYAPKNGISIRSDDPSWPPNSNDPNIAQYTLLSGKGGSGGTLGGSGSDGGHGLVVVAFTNQMLTISPSTANVTVIPGSTPSVTFTASGGTPPYEYFMVYNISGTIPDPKKGVFTALTSGAGNIIQVIDAYGAFNFATINVTVP